VEKERKLCKDFLENIYRITISLSAHSKTHCFAFPKYGFYMVKAAVLCSKTTAFAMPNRHYRFLYK